MNEMPTIKIEMNGVRSSVIHAFDDRLDEMKDYALKVIDTSFKLLENGGLEKQIIDIVQSVLEHAISYSIKATVTDCVYDYFASGEGRDAILLYIRKGFEEKEE